MICRAVHLPKIMTRTLSQAVKTVCELKIHCTFPLSHIITMLSLVLDARVQSALLISCVTARSAPYIQEYLWWTLRILYLLACQVRVTVGDSGLCCLCNGFQVLINSFVNFLLESTYLWIFSKLGQISEVHFISRRTPVVCFHVSEIALTLKKH